MALREFRDGSGRHWEVWDTVPVAPSGDYSDTPMGRLLANSREGTQHETDRAPTPMPGRFTPGRELGWLTFASGTSRRRLSPIPDGWQSMSESDLAGHLMRADAVASAPVRIGRQENKA